MLDAVIKSLFLYTDVSSRALIFLECFFLFCFLVPIKFMTCIAFYESYVNKGAKKFAVSTETCKPGDA